MKRRILLVMLPGALCQSGDFAAHGFLDALQRQTGCVDVIAADLPAERYLEGDVAEWLHGTIIAAALGQRRLWLLGISLGAMGALLYAQAHAPCVEGMILLAPFLGTQGLIAEVEAAGGLAAWGPGEIAASDRERRLLAGLKHTMPQSLHLGYGTADRYVAASRMLAQNLPAERVTVIDGGHDWPTWERLWSEMLATGVLDA